MNSQRVSNHIYNPLVSLLFYCHTSKHFVPYQHKWPNVYIWLCRGKNAHTNFVEIGYTSKLLQGEMCQSSMTQPIMKNMPVVVMAFNIPGSCVLYIAVVPLSKKSTSTFLFA